MHSYWDNSWKTVDPQRVARYIDSFDLATDPLMEYLHTQQVKTVCDAGCGCGIYTCKLAANGFSVSGFDVSSRAVQIAQDLLDREKASAQLKTASVLSTGYPDQQFDCVLSRDVLDHMTKQEAAAAVQELFRILRPGGILIFTLDALDEEYQSEPHTVTADGDYHFTSGKWKGMVFHPYHPQEAAALIPSGAAFHVANNDGALTITIKKPA